VVPVGYDALGCIYWLFDDCRLYREAPWRKEQIFTSEAGKEVYTTETVPVQSNGINKIKIKIKTMGRDHLDYWQLVFLIDIDVRIRDGVERILYHLSIFNTYR
jgi:hypothetical protein